MQICIKKNEKIIEKNENENENEKNLKTENEKIKFFEFIYSVEFNNLHEKYKRIADSGDINNMAIFLSQNPYHPEGVFIHVVYIYTFVFVYIYIYIYMQIFNHIHIFLILQQINIDYDIINK
jgi:hypothetical protein